MTDLPKNFGGIPGYVLDILIKNGFDTVEKLKAASDKELISVDGIGAGRVKLIRKAIAEIEDYAVEPTNFKWVKGWNWKKSDDGRSYIDFSEGTQIRRLCYDRRSQEIGVLISYPE